MKFAEMVLMVFGLLVGAAGVIGYITNIVKLIAAVSDPLTGLFIVRIAGLFFVPIGMVAGYM